MKQVGFLFVCAMLYTASCREKNCDFGNLDAVEKAWIGYTSGERVVFYSASDQTYDTAYASNPVFEFHAGAYSQDDCGPHGTESGVQRLTFASGNQTMDLSVTHDYDRMGSSAYLNFNQIPETGPGAMVINGHSYEDVRVIEYDSSQCVDLYVWRYCINQQFGVLKFERKNGPTWELVR